MSARHLPGFVYDPTTNRYYREQHIPATIVESTAKGCQKTLKGRQELENLVSHRKRTQSRTTKCNRPLHIYPTFCALGSNNVTFGSRTIIKPIILKSEGPVYPRFGGRAEGLFRSSVTFPGSLSYHLGHWADGVLIPERCMGWNHWIEEHIFVGKHFALASAPSSSLSYFAFLDNYSQQPVRCDNNFHIGTFTHGSQSPDTELFIGVTFENKVASLCLGSILRPFERDGFGGDLWAIKIKGTAKSIALWNDDPRATLVGSTGGHITLYTNERLNRAFYLPAGNCASQLWHDPYANAVYAATFHGQIYMLDPRYGQSPYCFADLSEFVNANMHCVMDANDLHIVLPDLGVLCSYDIRRSHMPYAGWFLEDAKMYNHFISSDSSGMKRLYVTASKKVTLRNC